MTKTDPGSLAETRSESTFLVGGSGRRAAGVSETEV